MSRAVAAARTRSTTGRGRGCRTPSGPSTCARWRRDPASATTGSRSSGRASRASIYKIAQTRRGRRRRRLDVYAALADTFTFEEECPPTVGGGFGLLVREPVGVVGAIIPWNGPLALIATRSIRRCSPDAPSC